MEGSAAKASTESPPALKPPDEQARARDSRQATKLPRLVRAPLVPAAAAVLVGILAGRYAALTVGFWGSLAVLATAVAAATFLRPHLHLATCIALVAGLAALSALHTSLCYDHVDSDHVVTYAGPSSHLAALRGRIVSTPQTVREDPLATLSYPRPARTSFLLQCRAIRTGQTWQPVSGLARVTVKEPASHLAAGQDVELEGWLRRHTGPDNPGQVDRAAAGRRDGVLVRMELKSADAAAVLSGEDRPWYSRAYWNLRSAARQHLENAGDEDDARLVSALVIGERHRALSGLNRTMMRLGVAHYLSISGTHLAVFLGFVYLLCRLAMLTPSRSAAIVLAVLGAYVLLAEPNGPLLRSAVMAAVMCLAVIFHRQFSPLNALSAAAIVLLAADPMRLFSPGFQLSFAIVLGLIVLHRPLRGWLFGRWLTRRGLIVFRDDQRLRRWLYWRGADLLIDAAVMSLSAYVVSAPLVAWHFGLFSPYAAGLSILLIVPVAAVLVPGYLALALAWPMPNLAHRLAQAASWAADGLSSLAGALEELPGATVELRPVGAMWVMLFYSLIVLVAARRRLPFGWALVSIAALALAAATFQTQRTSPAPPAAQLNVLAVGGGQCVVLRAPSGRTFCFDAGTRSELDVYESALAPFLRFGRLPWPQAAFVSHANTDHFNGLAALARSKGLKRAYLNDHFASAPGHCSEAAAELLAQLRQAGAEIVRLRAPHRLELDDRTAVQVLWPPAQKRDDLDPNESSLVLRITCDGQSVLLPGDVGEIAQSAMLDLASAGEIDLRSDVLMLPHHGGWSRCLPRFVEAVSPRIVLASSHEDPRGPISPAAARPFLAALKNSRQYFNTRLNGFCQVRFGDGRVTVQAMR